MEPKKSNVFWAKSGVYVSLFFCVACLGIAVSYAQTPPSSGISDRELQRQQELLRQQKLLMQENAPAVRLQKQEKSLTLGYPEHETPCFDIRQITLTGDASDKFQWALKDVADVPGRCLGARGINVVMTRVQNAIIDRGYTTTRVVAKPQDIKSGKLELTVIPGRVSAIRFAKGSQDAVWLGAAIPIRPGDILNIRDLEQGLENLRGVPTVGTDIQIAPGAKAGKSDLVVNWKRAFPIRVSLSTDNSGSKDTGRYQGNATLSFDDPLGLSDLFYISASHSLERNKPYGTRNYSYYYSVPFGYNRFTVSWSDYTYHQTVAGYSQNYVYSGDSRTLNFELSRVLLRTASSKTSVSVSTYFDETHNFVDGEEVDVQKKRLAGWGAGISHEHFIGNATLDANLNVQRGSGMFRSQRVPEEEFDEGTSRPEIFSDDFRLMVPFHIESQNFRYIAQWRQQWTSDALIAKDRFTIGNRYTVRGYDGNYTLSAENGFYLRNELAWQFGLAGTSHEFYLGYDVGHVHGHAEDQLLGKTLTGMAEGIRGSVWKFNYDFFVSEPLSRPKRFPGSHVVLGFDASLSF